MDRRLQNLRDAERIAALNPEWTLFKVIGARVDYLRLSREPLASNVDVTCGFGYKTWAAWRGDEKMGYRYHSPGAAISALGYKINEDRFTSGEGQ